MLPSRGMIQPEKVASTEEGHGQISEQRGFSSDLDLQPLPLVPLRRSHCLKENISEGNRVLLDLRNVPMALASLKEGWTVLNSG